MIIVSCGGGGGRAKMRGIIWGDGGQFTILNLNVGI